MPVKMVQLTIFDSANEKLDSMYGWVSFREWLNLEKTRIEKADGRVAEIRSRGFDGKKQYALFVDNRGDGFR